MHDIHAEYALMDIQKLEIYADVMRMGSFAAAARLRDMDPSSVSRAIAALETMLSARLFQRTTRRLTPTEAGQAYFDRIEPLLADLKAAAEALGDHDEVPRGHLRLTASVAFGQCVIGPLLPALYDRHPELSVELVLTDRNIDLIADRIDLAVRLAPRPRGDLIARKLLDTRYRVCASPDYVSRQGWPVDPQALADHGCLLLDLPKYRESWQFRHPNGRIEQVAIAGRMTISNPVALRDAAIAGLGPTLLADWLVREALASGELLDLYPGLDAAATEFETAAWLLYPSRQYLPLKVRAAIDFLTDALS